MVETKFMGRHGLRMQSTRTAPDRVLGCLLGGAVGDALGEAVEFMSPGRILKSLGPAGVDGYWDRAPNPGAISDDTQMILFTAEGIIRHHLGNGVAASHSVLTAQWCHLFSESFQETILTALGIGGDTDTIASMAGAVAGARYGYGSIPEVWRGVESADRLVELADRMWAARDEVR